MTFEQSKNIKALGITLGIHLLLLLVFLLVKYPTTLSASYEEMYMEVNLGTTEDGFGDDQPEDVNDPAAAQPSYDQSANAINTTFNDEIKEVSSDENGEVVVQKPNQKKPNVKNAQSVNPTTNNARKTPVTTPSSSNTKTQQKPKYVMDGATGTGGNAAQDNRAGGNEGIGQGVGDMGVPGGTVGAKNYFGTSYRLGNRKMVAKPSPTASFKEGGKVIVSVTVNREGDIINYRISSAANTTLRRLAEEKIKSIKFNKSPNAPVEQFGDITFDFSITR